MSTLLITVKSGRTGTDLADKFNKDTTHPRGAINNIINYFASCVGGAEGASIDVQTASGDPVSASATVTLTYASIAAADTVTIAGTVLTCSAGAPAASQFQKLTDGPTTAANLAAAINAQAVIKTYVYATAVGSVVTVRSLVKHALGNLVTVATSNAAGFTLSSATLVGGAGGSAGAPVNYAAGL